MRRLLGLGAVVVAAAVVAHVAGAARVGDTTFAPRSPVISRTSFLGITPRTSYAQVRAQWGTPTDATTVGGAAVKIGRSSARWGNHVFIGPTAATAYYADREPGLRPFRYTVDLAFARETGVNLRTVRGDRAGTSTKAFRRHWPGARRHVSEPGYVWYVAPSAHAGWRLAFLLVNGQLRTAELVTTGYVARCIVRTCRIYQP